MNARKQEKNGHVRWKNFNFWFLNLKKYALRAIWISRTTSYWWFFGSRKLDQLVKLFISLGNLITNLHFRNSKSITFFATFTILLFDSGICLLNKEIEVSLEKIKRKSNLETSKMNVNKLRPFPEKKHVHWLCSILLKKLIRLRLHGGEAAKTVKPRNQNWA